MEYVMKLSGKNTIPDVTSISDILVWYRSIRQELHDKFRYEDAGKVFIREMELQRNWRDDQ